MRFMIIVKATKESEAGVMPKPEDGLMEAMADYHEDLARAGVLLDANGLHPTGKGFRIRYAGERRSIVDGPFAESKELICGYTLIQTKSREEAVEWARRMPNPYGKADGEIEVRQLYELDDFEPGDAVERFRKMDLASKAP